MKNLSKKSVVHIDINALVEFCKGKFTFCKPCRKSDTTALTDSVKRNGIVRPLIVRPKKEKGKFEILDGKKRLKAAKENGLDTVPCVVLDVDDLTALKIIETAQSFKQ